MPTTYWAFPTQTFTAFDANGDPVASAEASIFEAGTSTPLTTYTDTGLTTPHAVPQIADGNGIFAPIYISGADEIKVAVRLTGAGALLPGYPVDNITGTPIGGFSASGVVFDPTSLVAAEDLQTAVEILEDITQGQHTIWFGGGSGRPETTAGPIFTEVEQSTDEFMLVGFAFDASSPESLQVSWQAPKSYDDGTFILQYIWAHTTTTVNFGVSWEAKAVSLGNGESADATFGSEVNTDDTGGSTSGYKLYISPESTAITATGAAAEELITIKITRDVADGADTLAVDAVLLGIRVHYTTNANTDD